MSRLEGSTAAYLAALKGGSTMVTVHDAALEQRMAALRCANEGRAYRRELKARLKTRQVSVSDVLADDRARRLTVGDMLLAIPGVGRVKRDKVLRAAQVSPFKEVGGLTPLQRERLLRALATRAGIRS